MKNYVKTYQRKSEDDNRILTLGEINELSANEIIYRIYEINNLDKIKTANKREPIKLIINSSGGDVCSALGIIDVIELSQTPIHTICHGQALSMAFVILCSGDLRVVSNRATLMFHEMSDSVKEEKITKHKEALVVNDNLQKIIDNYVISKTLIKQKKLNIIKKLNLDWYITPQEALDLKIIDKII